MNKQLISEVGRINEIMGTKHLLVEQASIIKGLRLLLGIGEGAVKALKYADIVAKIPALSDVFITRLMRAPGAFPDAVIKSKNPLAAAKKEIAKGFNALIKGKAISEYTSHMLLKLAMESDDMYKIFTKELASKAKSMGIKMDDILNSNEMRLEFQKLLANKQIGLNLKIDIPDELLSKMADDFIKTGGVLKGIIPSGWWKKLWATMDDIDVARMHAMDAVFNKFLKNKSYFNVRLFIIELVDPAVFTKLAVGSGYKNIQQLADVIVDAIAKGKQVGRVELELLQKLMINNNKYRAVIYQSIAQSKYIKQYIRDIPVRVKADELTPKQVEEFFQSAIGSVDANDMVLFKSKLGFDWNIFKKQTWKNIISPVTWQYTFYKAKDMFFSPTKWPKFFKWYWGAFLTSTVINWIFSYLASKEGLLPLGKTKSEAGTNPDFFLKLKGAKTLILDEGGLDNEQAKTIAKMMHNLLNNLFDMEDNLPKLYRKWRDSMMPGEDCDECINDPEAIADLKAKYGDWDYDGDDDDKKYNSANDEKAIADLHNHRELFKKFSDWVEAGGKTDDGWDIGALTYLTGVSDTGIQGIYTDLIPTVLAASQVTYFYEEIEGKKGSLLTHLMKVEPIFFIIPIPLISRKFTEGVAEIFQILDDKKWMTSITKSEMSLSNILKTSVVKWPTFPDQLEGGDKYQNTYYDKNTKEYVTTNWQWCKWFGHIPAAALVTIMDGTDDGGKPASPAYEVGEDQQTWLKNLSIEEFNRAFLLSVEGKKESPYGYTQEQINATDNLRQESEANIADHVGQWVADMKSFKKMIMEEPDMICDLAPKLCALIKITKEHHEKKMEEND